MANKIRNLRAEEIECRVGGIYEKGITLLLYKNARVDQAILDEVFGMYGWQRMHTVINGEIYCTVSIWDEAKKCWITKQDVGTESNSEKVKGAASDSFKRACFNIGVGRELYTAPLIWIPINKVELKEQNGKKIVKDRFSVKSIEISEDKVITSIEIMNQKSEIVYAERSVAKKESVLTEAKMRNLRKEMLRTGVTEQVILDRYSLKSMEEMNAEIYERALAGLRKSKSVA